MGPVGRRWRRTGEFSSIYREKFKAQGGRCAICRERPNSRALALDHDHKTGEFRGLLCHGCNTGLGSFRDKADLVAAAGAYLAAWENQPRQAALERLHALNIWFLG